MLLRKCKKIKFREGVKKWKKIGKKENRKISN